MLSPVILDEYRFTYTVHVLFHHCVSSSRDPKRRGSVDEAYGGDATKNEERNYCAIRHVRLPSTLYIRSGTGPCDTRLRTWNSACFVLNCVWRRRVTCNHSLFRHYIGTTRVLRIFLSLRSTSSNHNWLILSLNSKFWQISNYYSKLFYYLEFFFFSLFFFLFFRRILLFVKKFLCSMFFLRNGLWNCINWKDYYHCYIKVLLKLFTYIKKK